MPWDFLLKMLFSGVKAWDFLMKILTSRAKPCWSRSFVGGRGGGGALEKWSNMQNLQCCRKSILLVDLSRPG